MQLSCELKYVNKILEEIVLVFQDFKKNFKPSKFAEFKQILTKKQDLATDTIGAEINHTYRTLRDYGQVETYQEFSQKISQVEEEDFAKFYQEIQNGLENIMVMVVSADKKVLDLKRN